MSTSALRLGLAGLVVLSSHAARAEPEHPRAAIDVTPVVSMDMGGSLFQPSLGSTMFSTLDTFNGQHTWYRATGAALGLTHPLGGLYSVTLHVFPFPFRGIGLASTFEIGSFTSNYSTASTPFGTPDHSSDTYVSLLVGPEAQIRLSNFVVRGGVLGGFRYLSVSDYTAAEWHAAVRGQVDWLPGGEGRKDTAFTLGLYGSGDIYPTFGWSLGASMAVAFL